MITYLHSRAWNLIAVAYARQCGIPRRDIMRAQAAVSRTGARSIVARPVVILDPNGLLRGSL